MSFEHGLGQLNEVDGNIVNVRVQMGILHAEQKRISELQHILDDIEKELTKLKKELINLEEEREMILSSCHGDEML